MRSIWLASALLIASTAHAASDLDRDLAAINKITKKTICLCGTTNVGFLEPAPSRRR